MMISRSMITSCLFGAALLVLAGPLDAAPGEYQAQRAQSWDAETLELAAGLPIQDDGRVKPLDTMASFALLRLNGKRSCEGAPPGLERLSPVAWLLDCLFFPEDARHEKCFLIANDEVTQALGLHIRGRRKRDRYAYAELAPARNKLAQLASQYSRIGAKEQTSVQRQIVHLAGNMFLFEAMTDYLSFTRAEFPVASSKNLAAIFEGVEKPTLADVLGRGGAIAELFHRNRRADGNKEGGGPSVEEDTKAIDGLMQVVEDTCRRADALALFAPDAPKAKVKEWLTPADLGSAAFGPEGVSKKHIEMLKALTRMERHKDDPASFSTEMRRFHETALALADARGEYRKVPMEVVYYQWDFFSRSQYLYVLAFLLVAMVWLRPANKWFYRAAWVALVPPTLLLIAGITLRCVIRERPPVTTLYETVLFITACIVLVAMVIEWINRQRIALSLGALLGMAGIFLANKYEIKEGVDTMPSLVAVLDTNFWLATHVTTVTLGYAAGLLACAVAHVYVLGKAFGLKRGNDNFYHNLARMVYGVLCFGLFFSILGTILGGIWANESWGRFWGWDPKENGALMIVLWELILLHGLLGGYVRDFGMCMGMIFGGIVVAFSWWHVNYLGVGLHSYGFTAGVVRNLTIYYGIEAGVLLVGMGAWLAQRNRARPESSRS